MGPSPGERVDVAVAGAGVAGLASALHLARARGPRLRIVVCDPALGKDAPHTLRAVAIAPASRLFLTRLDVWSAVEATAEPMRAMVLTDSVPGAVPAPTFLRFPAPAEADEPLAHMVLQDDLRAALLAACAAAGVSMSPCTIAAAHPAGPVTALEGPGLRSSARLLVVADGGRSGLREAAGIKSVGWDYDQAAIVATVAHSREHGGEAIQHFLPGGPLAFLPMRAADGTGRRSSIVWTERRGEVDRLMALGPEAFCTALSARGGFERGELHLEDARSAHPLRLRLSRGLIAQRLALAGDAARSIHPLAGQGLNLGLGDAEALGRHVAAATALGLDPGSARVLEGYQRDRRTDQVAMAGATDALNRLFSNDIAPVRLLRDLGLGLVDRSPGLKRWLAREASGLG